SAPPPVESSGRENGGSRGTRPDCAGRVFRQPLLRWNGRPWRSPIRFARGDENDQDSNGTIPGYVLIKLDMHYTLSPMWHVFLNVDNRSDRRYSIFGILR